MRRNRGKRKLYLLIYNQVNIIAISDDLLELQKYISQFKEFFLINQDKFQYKCEENGERISKIVNRYADELFVREFTRDILLTDLEISYHSPLLQELYSDFKRMMAAIIKMNDILNVDLELKSSMMSNFDKLYDKIYSYESFLNTLNRDILFSNYITDPLTTRFLYDESSDLEWNYRRNVDKED